MLLDNWTGRAARRAGGGGWVEHRPQRLRATPRERHSGSLALSQRVLVAVGGTKATAGAAEIVAPLVLGVVGAKAAEGAGAGITQETFVAADGRKDAGAALDVTVASVLTASGFGVRPEERELVGEWAGRRTRQRDEDEMVLVGLL